MQFAIYAYGAFAHAFAAFAHAGRSKPLYTFAHVLMGTAIAIRTIDAFQGSLATSIIGTIGHISIILYMLNSYDLRKRAAVALGILGHVGMQGVHWLEHYEKKHSYLDERFDYVRLATYAALFAFYLQYRSATRNEAAGRYLLAGLYLALLLELGTRRLDPKSI